MKSRSRAALEQSINSLPKNAEDFPCEVSQEEVDTMVAQYQKALRALERADDLMGSIVARTPFAELYCGVE